jgi:hypothetical protein
MYFNLEQFGTLSGRFFGVFLGDLEQFGTLNLAVWNSRLPALSYCHNTQQLPSRRTPTAAQNACTILGRS